jgi:hypothetical protein
MASFAASRNDTNTEPDDHNGPEETEKANVEIAQRGGEKQAAGSKPEQRPDPGSRAAENDEMFDPKDYQDHGPPLCNRWPNGKEIKISGKENQAECQ